jgi:hypothetical protein
MSTLFGGVFSKFPIIMVDEAQDLSPQPRDDPQDVRRKADRCRRSLPGDLRLPGSAHREHGLLLKKEFNCKELFLSTSFRCPKAVVRTRPAARPADECSRLGEGGRGPRLGRVDAPRPARRGLDHLPQQRPALLRRASPDPRRPGVHIRGNEIGKALVKILEKLGPDHEARRRSCSPSTPGRRSSSPRPAKAARPASTTGPSASACSLSSGHLEESIAYAQHLFEMTGPIELMTGHKAKGLENPRIFHLDSVADPEQVRRALRGGRGQLEDGAGTEPAVRHRDEKPGLPGLIDTEDYRSA